VFNFESHNVRTVIDDDGEIWFVAKDVCESLGISNHRDALTRLDDDEKDDVGITDTIGRTQQNSIINESGLYKLAFTSRKEEAKRFTKWVTSEVLPTIRKTGKYEIPKAEPKTESNLLENIKKAGEFIDVAMTMLNRLGIEGNQATLGANKVATKATYCTFTAAFTARLQLLNVCVARV
jgi:prophage antirepressor-like protein